MRWPLMMVFVENSMSSVSRWYFQPPISSMTFELMKKPVPETAQLVPRVKRAWERYFASRMNHTA